MDKDFLRVTKIVIDKLEGGYYHPDMLKDGRVRDSRYSKSGETLYGIDRKAGGKINETEAGKKFWALIDKEGARSKWKWNYMPTGELKERLQDLAAQIIYPEYIKNSNNYLSEKARKLVNSDDRLRFNFIYATWNGSGWFKSFASKINDAVQSGVTDTNKLTQIALDARINNQAKSDSARSLISQGGKKISSFIHTLKGKAENVYEGTTTKFGKSYVNIGIGVIALSLSLALGVFLYGKLKVKK